MGVLAEAGVTLVGENRLQDLEAKRERWGDAFDWDFIGNLQSRKVKKIVPLVRLIHSLATDSALEQLGKHATPETAVLVEVNLAGEESKGGVAPEELAGLHRALPGAGRGPDDDAAVQRGPRGLAAVLRPPRRARRRARPASASRWAPARTGGWPSRRGRRSSASARCSTPESAHANDVFIIRKRNKRWKAESEPEWRLETHGDAPWSTSASSRATTSRRASTPTRTTPARRWPSTSTAVAPREEAPVAHAPRRRRGREEDVDDIFGDDEPRAAARGGRLRAVDEEPPPAAPRRQRRLATSRCTWSRRAASTTPSRSPTSSSAQAGDHQPSEHRPRALQAPDRLRLRHDLRARRRHAARLQGIFLLTPANVEVSAEEKARILEGGFFNQS